MLIRIKGGRVLVPGRFDETADVLIRDGRIDQVIPAGRPGQAEGAQEPAPEEGLDIDASGRLVVPGLVDMHVHLRQPGHEYKETIASGCAAAAAGGFTAVCAMPNTLPVNDNRQVTEFILEEAERAGAARVYPAAAVSLGQRGEELCEYGELRAAGAVALTDDGRPVTDNLLMRRALEYASTFGLPVISHCECLDLSAEGVMNEGAVATRLGLGGIPNAAESIMVMRDIALCELTGVPVHIAHVSSRESVRAIREAKASGLPVTAETAPHYFTLTDADVGAYNTHAKMNPPLRSERDREAVRSGLADGTLDVIATDHAPHSSIEKDLEFNLAANGIIGMETALPLALGLVRDGVLDLAALLAKLTVNPARILGVPKDLQAGGVADITIIDPEQRYTIDAARFRSLSRNTPFDGWQVQGKAVATIVQGRLVFDELGGHPL